MPIRMFIYFHCVHAHMAGKVYFIVAQAIFWLRSSCRLRRLPDRQRAGTHPPGSVSSSAGFFGHRRAVMVAFLPPGPQTWGWVAALRGRKVCLMVVLLAYGLLQLPGMSKILESFRILEASGAAFFFCRFRKKNLQKKKAAFSYLVSFCQFLAVESSAQPIRILAI